MAGPRGGSPNVRRSSCQAPKMFLAETPWRSAFGVLPSPPNRGLPGFGTLDWPKSGKPDFGWGGVGGGGSAILSQVAPPLSRRATPSPPSPSRLRLARFRQILRSDQTPAGRGLVGGGSRPSLRRDVLADECARLPHAGGDELLETHRVAFARGLARLDARKAARLDEPLPPGRQLPAALHGVARVPAHRLVLDVHHLVMGVEQLDAVTVRIAHIDEERVAWAMAARSELDIGGKAHLGGEIADVEEVIGFRDRERGVMEPRPCPGGEDDIVRVALALQEDEQQLLGSIRRDVFREPEA